MPQRSPLAWQSSGPVNGGRPDAPAAPDRALRSRATVVVAHDELLRRGLIDVIAAEPAMRIVCDVADARDVAMLLDDGVVDVLVLDVDAHDRDGIAEAIAIKERRPEVAVMILARSLTETDLLGAVRAGIDAIASRTSPIDEVRAVLRRAADGEPALDDICTSALVRAVRRESDSLRTALTGRELEVLALIARGERNADIGRELFISESTVKFHLRNIIDKLGAHSRAEAVALAIRLGLV